MSLAEKLSFKSAKEGARDLQSKGDGTIQLARYWKLVYFQRCAAARTRSPMQFVRGDPHAAPKQ